MAGCGPDQTIVLLKDVPEIDHSAIDELVTYEGAEISESRMFVVVKGTAKVDMGPGRGVRVQRHTKDGLLDTIAARISSAKEVVQPEPTPVDPNRDPNVMPPRPPMPKPALVEAGGPVQIDIDATMSGGRITKLVIMPGPAEVIRIAPEGPEPGSVPTAE
jgi:hypothetical protein